MNINDIAEMAGVSRATVSRYLNNGYVSQDKKERIKKVIDETGYKPSVFARTLRSKQTMCIGIIIPKINSDSIGRMVTGISSVLDAADYKMLLGCTDNDPEKEIKYLKLFRENLVDGIILMGTVKSRRHQKIMKEYPVPIVVLAQKFEGFSSVYSDDYHAAYSIGELLSKTGKNFGMISVTEKDIAVGLQRKKGYADALKKAGKVLKKENIYECGFKHIDGYEAGRLLVTQHPETDTVFCATDTIACGFMKYLNEEKIKVPEKIQVAGCGDSTISGVIYPALTTVHFHYEEAGRQAARLLLDKLNNGEDASVQDIKLECDLLVKQSTR